MHKAVVGFILIVIGLTVFAQSLEPPFGSPLPGLTSREMELFRLGREDFMEVETPGDGLGPAFNGTSCAQCHSIPVIGGTGTILETRAGKRDADGAFSAPPGGTLHHLFSIAPHDCQVSVDDEANVVGHRISMPLFGIGLVEAIPDETILALADPEDANGDGISGRAAVIEDVATGRKRVGRFGWKAQHATLLAFAADAYRNEMGITNDLFRDEAAAFGDPDRLRRCDPASDPEDVRDPRTGMRGLDNFENFLRLLAPVSRGPITGEVERGEFLFREIGCAACHVPVLMTGPNPNPLFDRKPVRLFSDLLLHDIGTGDGIEQDAAMGEEIRTPSLWGLRLRRPFMHDGRAATFDQAIQQHDGEGAGARGKFQALDEMQRAELRAFLKSL